jgi:hypothetical protein
MDFGAVLDDDQSRFAGPLATLADASNFDLDDASDETTGGNGPTCFVTFHTEAEACRADDFLVHSMQIGDFVAFLRQQAGAVIKKKSEKLFFNPCVFVPPAGADGYRRLEYFKQSSFLVLDFDGGILSPEDFERIFWTDAARGRKRSFVICNSFDRSAKDPNKFRVVLFYKRPATSLEQHKAVYAAIVARLEEHGFTAESAKLDPQCKSGVQSFYLPCTNEEHLDWAFFTACGTKTRDLERCAIDPVAYGKTTVLSRPVSIVTFRTNDASSTSREKIDEAVAHLRSLTTRRHRAILDGAMKLCRLGLSRTEVEAELLQAVGSEPKMRKKVADALRYLSEHQWFSRDARVFSQAGFAGSPQANTMAK